VDKPPVRTYHSINMVSNRVQRQILVSALLKELTDSAGDIRFGEVREVELKGLAGVNRVYPVVWE